MPYRKDPETHIRGAVLLGHVAEQLPVLDVSCNRCDRRSSFYTRRLMEDYGADMPLLELLPILSTDCPRRIAGRWHDVCGAHFPELSRVRL